MRRGDRRGVALLEAMVALAVVSTAGLAAAVLVGAQVRRSSELRERERRQQDASRLLAAMTLLTRSDLDIRLGARTIGPWIVDVQRPEPTLYRVAIAAADRPAAEELVTVVYRPATVQP